MCLEKPFFCTLVNKLQKSWTTTQRRPRMKCAVCIFVYSASVPVGGVEWWHQMSVLVTYVKSERTTVIWQAADSNSTVTDTSYWCCAVALLPDITLKRLMTARGEKQKRRRSVALRYIQYKAYDSIFNSFRPNWTAAFHNQAIKFKVQILKQRHIIT